MIYRTILVFFVFLASFGLLAPDTSWANNISRLELKAALKELLKEDPSLLMDVLKDNSEIVLEIAQQGNMERKRKLLFAQWMEDSQKPKEVNFKNHAIRGVKNAAVTIVEYSDYTCNFCRQSEIVLEILQGKYKKEMNRVFKAIPNKSNPLSLAAAQYSLAAFMQDEKKGWEFHDLLFENIEEMSKSGDLFVKEAAEKLGLDLKKLQKDASGAKVQEILDADKEEADRLGVTGTPHFLVNNLVIGGAVSVDVFASAVDLALKINKEENKIKLRKEKK